MKSLISSSVVGRFACGWSDASLVGAWWISKVGGME